MPSRLPLSVLDVSPIPSGGDATVAIANTVDLARLTESLGYERYWLAEHHNTAGIASSVPEILIAHVAAATTTLRVGSGGIMLPNHTPLHVAESFRLLDAMHPGRIDLGLGRAPGTDGVTALALRRSRAAVMGDEFASLLEELLAFFTGTFGDDHPFRTVVPSPRSDRVPPIYLLGSSGYSAAAAAQLGLGFAFAHHINPEPAAAVMRAYRNEFTPSVFGSEPHAILGLAAVVADDDAAADRLAATADLAWLRIGQGRGGPLPSVEEALAHPWSPAEEAQRRQNRSRFTIGDPDRVAARLGGLAEESGADEVMVLSMIHDHQARRRSYELLAQAFELQPAAAA